MLAPMVRVGSCPFRLLSLQYGADLVYTEETIARKLLTAYRTENNLLGTVDFVDTKSGRVVFRTHPSEKDRLIFQMGTADPQEALTVARLVQNDVMSIDLNCGCPVHFSTQGGMGSALLKTPDLLEEILKTLVDGCAVPVTAKIRIFDELDKTLSLVKRLESTGISALGVHCRTVKDRPKDRGRWEVFKPIVDSLNIPVILNGDIFTRQDIDNVLKLSGASSVMLARAAQSNPSIFRSEGLLSLDDHVIPEYLKKCVYYDYPYQTPKYTICSMIELKYGKGPTIQTCKSLRVLCELYGVQDYFDEVTDKRVKIIASEKKENRSYEDDDPQSYIPKKPRLIKGI